MLRPMAPATETLSRRAFIQRSALATGAVYFGPAVLKSAGDRLPSSQSIADLPKGAAPIPVDAPHFPDRVHSRIGFEASNQYYYVPVDLAEKILNCRDLLDRWLPAEKKRWL